MRKYTKHIGMTFEDVIFELQRVIYENNLDEDAEE